MSAKTAQRKPSPELYLDSSRPGPRAVHSSPNCIRKFLLRVEHKGVFYVASISAANVAFEDLTLGARSPGYNPQFCADWLYDPEPQFPHL